MSTHAFLTDASTPLPGFVSDKAARADYATPLLGVVIDKAGRADYATPAFTLSHQHVESDVTNLVSDLAARGVLTANQTWSGVNYYSTPVFTTPIVKFTGGAAPTAGQVLTIDADGRATFKTAVSGPATIDYTANQTWTGLNAFTTTPLMVMSGLSFGSGTEIISKQGTGQIRSNAFFQCTDGISAKEGAGSQVNLGAVGPSSEAGIMMGSSSTARLYKSGSNAMLTDGSLEAATFKVSTPIIAIGTSANATAGNVLTIEADGRATFKAPQVGSGTFSQTASYTLSGLWNFTTPIFLNGTPQSTAFQGYATPSTLKVMRTVHTIALSGQVATPIIPTDRVIPPFFISLGANQTSTIKKIRGRVDSTTPITVRLLKNEAALSSTSVYNTFQVNGAEKDVVTGDVVLSDNDKLQATVLAQAATPAYNLSLTIVVEHTF